MDDTILIITAWRRPDYLARTLASWLAVPELKWVRRVIIKLGMSDQFDEQVKTVNDFRTRVSTEVSLVPDSHEAQKWSGEHYSLGEALIGAFGDQGCRYVIHGSEDVIVSDDVLRYFKWARMCVHSCFPLVTCAHNSLGQGWQSPRDDSDADQRVVRLSSSFSPWVWGCTRQAWEDVIAPEWDWFCAKGPVPDERGWDWQVQRLVSATDRTAVVPDASRSQNIGEQGGMYAAPESFPVTQAQSFRPQRGEVKYRWDSPAV